MESDASSATTQSDNIFTKEGAHKIYVTIKDNLYLGNSKYSSLITK